MKNVKFASISDQLINTAIILDMMFNIEVIVKDMKGGKEDMTEKRFINDIDDGKLIDTKGELSTIHYSDKVDFYELWEFLNKLNDENEQLKQQNEFLKKRCNEYWEEAGLNSDYD